MFLDQFVLGSLGHASYLVGSEGSGEALLLDPRRDVDIYFEAARRRNVRIAYAMDTHAHNDYVSGISEIAARVPGIGILGSAHGDYGYDHRDLRHGERLEVGDAAFEILHTPGHTPEHVSLLVREGGADDPVLLLSGGALLVGDVARPDLLGDASRTRESARAMCATIQEVILGLPDHVQVFPTHVAGSLCGAHIGSRMSTTIGYERRTNELLSRVSSSDVFVRECLDMENLPAVPPYWSRMRGANLAGPALLGIFPEPPALSAHEVGKLVSEGAIVLDARSPEAFGGEHVPGALNVELGPSFPTWAGTVLPAGARVVLVLDRATDLPEAVWHLLRIGYDPPAGWLAGGMPAWREEGEPIERMPLMTVHELRERLEAGEIRVLDVRQPAEWAEGHIEGATFVTGAELPSRVDDVPGAGPLAVVCGTGLRSSVAGSVLQREGRPDLVNVLGGMTAWGRAGYPTTPG
jgi:hydroxyacylglutathione hydrolase